MQRTSNYGLCQYEGSDKTSYLVNYNDDMLKIDTAIKSAADGASAAQTKADTADGKADTNAGNISTLNTQINGAGGIASDVGALQGNVQTITSLIGDGQPTTSNQTIIGAINGLEGAIAPREDADTLANSYSIGDQFARGGSVYEALTSLTAGTAFASLVLNTNYKTADSLVEQIDDVKGDVNAIDTKLDNNIVLVSTNETIEVTADGVKTLTELVQELMTSFSNYQNTLADNELVKVNHVSGVMQTGVSPIFDTYATKAAQVAAINCIGIAIASGHIELEVCLLSTSTVAARYTVIDGTNIPTNVSTLTSVPSDGSKMTLYFEKYKKL